MRLSLLSIWRQIHRLFRPRKQMRATQIVQFSLPRTGSTVVWQILSYMFDDRVSSDLWKQPVVVEKSHTWQRIVDTKKYVITIRDPRDSIASRLQLGVFECNIQAFLNQCRFYKKEYARIIRLMDRNPGNILFLRYEQFFGNNSFICDAIEEFFGIIIDAAERDEIEKRFSLSANKQRSDSLTSFQQYDPLLLIHGQHIKNQSVSHWQTTIPVEYHNIITRALADVLTALQYA